MQLPSNKIGGLFILVVLAVVIVIAGDIFYDKLRPGDEPDMIDADLVLRRNTDNTLSGDSDGDGLLDWQEGLYGSDANIADTDGDGTSDGDEIKERRDPTIPGPDDTLVQGSDLISTDLNVGNYVPGSLTDEFSKELFANYLTLKSENNLNSETGNELVNSLTSNLESSAGLEKKYSTENLNLVLASKDSIQKYGEDFAIVYTDYLLQMESAKNLIGDDYVNEIARLYGLMADVLSRIETPDVFKNVHVEVLNRLYNSGVLLLEVNEYESDPLKSLIAIRKIQQNSEGDFELYSSIANYFEDNDIIFTDNKVISFWNSFK